MKVADAMTPRAEVVTVELPGTRDDVLEYLQKRGFSSVPVVKRTDDGEVYRGLVSRRELIENPDQDQLAMLMREVPTTTADAELEAVARIMLEGDARRVPVVDSEARSASDRTGDNGSAVDGRLEGIITVTDVVRAIARGDADGESPVGDLAVREINTTYAATPLTVVEWELNYANVPYAVVLDGTGDMDGIVTEVDIIEVARVVEGEDETGDSMANQDDEWMWEGIKAVGNRYIPTRNVEIPAEPVETFMTSEMVTVSRRRNAREAAQQMISNDVEQIPVVSGGSLAAILRDVNLLEAL